MEKIIIRPLGALAHTLDAAFTPLMCLAQGTFDERPQQTHRWNNHHLSRAQIAGLDRDLMLHHRGSPDAPKLGRIRRHVPVLGGWREYIVLAPKYERVGNWHAGWADSTIAGVSRIPVRGNVRVLIGSGTVSFFGIDAFWKTQCEIRQVGEGRIGDGGEFAHVLLL